MRYIGNKVRLLSEIDALLKEKGLKKQGLIFCDMFSGTATVANNYNNYYKIIANDLLSLSYEMSAGVLTYNNMGFKNLGFDPFEYFSSTDCSNYTKGFCYNNFSPNGGCQYFSDENAKHIDFIRDTIDEWYSQGKILNCEKSYLIMCLLESVSKVSNVAGVYSAFLKIWDPRALKKMMFLPIEVKKSKYKNKVYCEDSNKLINKISGDILYLDPPYTTTQYNSQYHTLETIARNDYPETHGIGKHRTNDRMSNWCKKGCVEYEFEELIKNAKFKHIILSYSDKGIMSPKFIEAVLKRYAKQGTYTFKKINFIKYKSTRAVNKEIADGTRNRDHFEYMFYIEKEEEKNIKYISPLNYIGGKYQALDLIKTHLPKGIKTFYDVFGGGFTVGINTASSIVKYSDINGYVVSLLEYLSSNKPSEIYALIQKSIKKYGLKKENKEGYYKLRDEYNRSKSPLLLYLLICYGFEHQIRFNSNHKFNNPCGNSGFNEEMFEKLISFYLRCKDLDITFKCQPYNAYFDEMDKNSFVYLDPPYLSANGVYQDGKRGFNGWDEKQEKEMYDFMEKLNSRGVKFLISNFTEHEGKENSLLLSWAKQNGFSIVFDDKITKRNRRNRRELIVFNYEV